MTNISKGLGHNTDDLRSKMVEFGDKYKLLKSKKKTQKSRNHELKRLFDDAKENLIMTETKLSEMDKFTDQLRSTIFENEKSLAEYKTLLRTKEKMASDWEHKYLSEKDK